MFGISLEPQIIHWLMKLVIIWGACITGKMPHGPVIMTMENFVLVRGGWLVPKDTEPSCRTMIPISITTGSPTSLIQA